MSEIKDNFFDIDLGHKVVRARKWKAKDRKNFRKALVSEKNVDKAIIDALVMSCLEDKNVALNYKEIQYILIELRKHSISSTFRFKYECSKCDKVHDLEVEIDEVNKKVWSEWGTVKGIEFGDIANAKFYNENKDEEDEIKEMAFHVKSIDGKIDKTFEEVIEYFEDMDVDVFDEILEEFLKMDFSIDNIKEFECSCGAKKKFEFDEIPGFFPEKWLA